MIRLGTIVVIVKLSLLLLMAYAMFSGGLPKRQRLWLGVEVVPVNETIRIHFAVTKKGGVLINSVVEHSPAEQAGLQRGDIILNIDNRPVFAASDIRRVLDNRRYRDTVGVVFSREGTVYATKAVLDHRAATTNARSIRSLYHYRLTLPDLLGLMLLGLVAGAFSGMIGCGGGVLKVSLLMIFFGFEIFLAKVVSLISCGFMSLSSSHRYIKHKQVDREALRYLIPSALAGVLIGIAISILLDRHVLEIALGVFLIYAALDIFYQIHSSIRNGTGHFLPDNAAPAVSERRGESVLIFAGLPMGLVSAILGITGGVIGTPLQRYLAKLPIKTCIANTLVTAIFVSFLGGILLLIEGLVRHSFSMGTFVRVVCSVIPGSLLGGQLGALLNKELPVNYVKSVYASMILFIAYKLLF